MIYALCRISNELPDLIPQQGILTKPHQTLTDIDYYGPAFTRELDATSLEPLNTGADLTSKSQCAKSPLGEHMLSCTHSD
jgi:hypothetical protein